MAKKKSNRSRLIAMIHTQKSAAQLTDEEYRLIIYGATGNQSCTECSMQDLFKIFADMNIVLELKGKRKVLFQVGTTPGKTLQDSVIARAKKILGDEWEIRLKGFLKSHQKENLSQCSDKELRQIQGWLSNVERTGK